MTKKILVVDDSKTVRQQVTAALEPAGFATIEAADGAEALEVLSQTPDALLVVCDVNMPGMNGLDFLDALKRDEKFKNLPVLMLTSDGQPHLIERARKAGASGWLVKPFKPELLSAAVTKLSEKARSYT